MKGNCVAVMQTQFQYKHQNNGADSTAEEERFLDLQRYTDLHQGPTTLPKLSHDIAIQKLQGKATRYSPLRHWETTKVIKRLTVSALPQLFLHPKSAEKLRKKLLRLFANEKMSWWDSHDEKNESLKFWKLCKSHSTLITIIIFKPLKMNTLFFTVLDLA